MGLRYPGSIHILYLEEASAKSLNIQKCTSHLGFSLGGLTSGVPLHHGAAVPPALPHDRQVRNASPGSPIWPGGWKQPVYSPGCKSPLPVAEWAAGKPDCKAPGRKPYFRYSSTLHPDQDRRPCTRNPFPQTRDLPPRLGLRHSHRHRLPRPVPRLVGETRQCHVTDNPRSPQERRHQCPQSRSP